MSLNGGTGALLDVEGVSLNFGGINALSNIDLTVREREIFALIGPNGAGKSTLFNCITRLYKPTAGSIAFAGQNLLALQSHDLPRIGIARTFQNTALFPQLSVLDNVLVGGHHATDRNAARAVLRTGGWRRSERDVGERAESLLASLSLESVARRQLSSLDFPTQKRVELARALLASPRLLLLDEPAGGLSRDEAEELSGLVRALRDTEGLTVLLVEHHMAMVMKLADRICVLDSGYKLAEGTP
ncbi:MAG TPA: ATP-binding cassette domain-containing protein, partial [Acidimicrobiales bacterium]|nr:ATP-binding cassette domain-containing protein [Acidimicrobiales bacterium]